MFRKWGFYLDPNISCMVFWVWGLYLNQSVSLPSNSDSMKRDPRNRTLGVAEKKGNKKGF